MSAHTPGVAVDAEIYNQAVQTAYEELRALQTLNAELLTEFSESVKVFEVELATMKKLINKAKRERE